MSHSPQRLPLETTGSPDDPRISLERRTPMRPFQTILFAADFSVASQEAFRMACSLAVVGETRLHVLHVIEPDWVPEEPAGLGQVIQFYDAGTDEGRDETLKRRLCAAYAPPQPVDVAYH